METTEKFRTHKYPKKTGTNIYKLTHLLLYQYSFISTSSVDMTGGIINQILINVTFPKSPIRHFTLTLSREIKSYLKLKGCF